MTTNYQWLLDMDGEQRKAWFDAERVELESPQESILTAEKDKFESDSEGEIYTPKEVGDHPKQLYVTAEGRTLEWRKSMAEIMDSREKLEADISKYLDYPNDCRAVYDYNVVIGWLDRQANITYCEERDEYAWMHKFLTRTAKKCGTADCPSLIAYVEGLESKVADLEGQVEQWMNAAGNAHDLWEKADSKRIEAEAERETYRNKLGKCLDFADEIRGLA